MIWIASGLEFLHVTTGALGSNGLEVVLHMAQKALRGDVSASQREGGLGMIEVRWLPCCGRVAGVASLREAGCDVVGIGRLVEVRQVATGALSRRPSKDIVDVALSARRLSVCTGESEFRSRVVIERRTKPIDGRMA